MGAMNNLKYGVAQARRGLAANGRGVEYFVGGKVSRAVTTDLKWPFLDKPLRKDDLTERS